uniref:Uncharacterized protein n=1 Tax=Parascaris equorum TaxID=6256 RepID=A0A914SFD5_PAREQ
MTLMDDVVYYMPVVCKHRVMSSEEKLRGGAKSSKCVLTVTPSNAAGCQPAIPKLAGTCIRYQRSSWQSKGAYERGTPGAHSLTDLAPYTEAYLLIYSYGFDFDSSGFLCCVSDWRLLDAASVVLVR